MAISFRQFKLAVFTLEGLNAFATGLYFNWLFFFTERQLHFGVSENLKLVALHGLVYAGSSWLGGWFAHRVGNYRALKLGFSIMLAALGAGFFLNSSAAQIVVLLAWTFGVCFTWPTLQSLISEGESSSRMPRMAGIYNIVWSGVSAVSFFIGGALFEKLGVASMFWVPVLIHLGQLGMVFWMERTKVNVAHDPARQILPQPVLPVGQNNSVARKTFLRFALLTNPFAYVAINTAIPMIPEVANRFHLSPMWAGFFCSLWFFARMGAFILFWLWPGWHYRFGILLRAKILLVASFLGVLLAPQLWVMLLAQVIFGMSVGLIYYSSLYYSMEGGSSRKSGRHGGLHEAMIGLGTFLGALVGASAKQFYPAVAGISIWSVAGLLLIGLCGLIWLRYRKETS